MQACSWKYEVICTKAMLEKVFLTFFATYKYVKCIVNDGKRRGDDVIVND